MNDVLLNDEDMSLMYLTERLNNGGKRLHPEQHQEVEMLFENYLLQARQGEIQGGCVDPDYLLSTL